MCEIIYKQIFKSILFHIFLGKENNLINKKKNI